MGQPTDVVKANKHKWYGAHWKMVKSGVLEMIPSKTAKTTGKAPLNEYSMVVEELAHPVHADRLGPMIVHPQTALPHTRGQWLKLWHDVCKLVGIDHSENWNRDLRASGITEGDEADAALEDLATQSAHNEKTTKRHYIRGHRAVIRPAEKRRAYRERQQKNNP